MKKIIYTSEALSFEQNSKLLVGHVLVDIYYAHDVEGFVNLREKDEKDFEYVPLSRVYFKMRDSTIFRFFDSMSFLNYDGFYTLDLKIEENLDAVNIQEKSQSNHHGWAPYLETRIVKVDIEWRDLAPNDQKPSIYPQSVIITFDNLRMIVIVASELDVIGEDEKPKYKFIYPDEALIIFFSMEAYMKYIGNE